MRWSWLCLMMFKSVKIETFLLAILVFNIHQLNAQDNVLQSITLAGGSFSDYEPGSFWIDWRLDLGCTAIEFNQSNAYFFTAGMFQPNVDRFSTLSAWKQYDPPIQLLYNESSRVVVLFSSAPDLIVYGFKIYNSNGRLLKTDATKAASSYLTKPIDLTGLSNGVYYMTVLYLPENIGLNQTNSYWIKTLKLLKQ